MKQFEIKRGLEVSTDDFWYDLTYGGYLRPIDICESDEDARIVNEAIDIILDFRESCEKQIEGFIR